MICLVADCDRPVRIKKYGWCKRHYERWRRHGDPTRVKEREGGITDEAVRAWKPVADAAMDSRLGPVPPEGIELHSEDWYVWLGYVRGWLREQRKLDDLRAHHQAMREQVEELRKSA